MKLASIYTKNDIPSMFHMTMEEYFCLFRKNVWSVYGYKANKRKCNIKVSRVQRTMPLKLLRCIDPIYKNERNGVGAKQHKWIWYKKF